MQSSARRLREARRATRVISGKEPTVSTVSFDVPEETLIALKLTPEGFAVELRTAGAMKLYEIGRLSSGAAAEMAGIPRPLFLSKLADYGIATFRLSASEVAEDVANA